MLFRRQRSQELTSGSILGLIGFLLSPLSWWNDLFINVPLAYGFAWLTGKWIDVFVTVNWKLFFGLFTLGYFLTNLAGFVLMGVGTQKFTRRRPKLKHHLMLSIGYTLLLVVFGLSGVIDPIIDQLPLAPRWVEK